MGPGGAPTWFNPQIPLSQSGYASSATTPQHPPAYMTAMESMMVRVYGMTEEYWRQRDAGPLPDAVNGGTLHAAARDQCMDWQQGQCVRTGQKCLLAGGRRCRWFEAAVLPAECNRELAAEFDNALRGVTVKRTGLAAAERVRMALEDLLREQLTVTAADVIRYSGVPANTVRNHIGPQARLLGLLRRGKGKGTTYGYAPDNGKMGAEPQ